jgi:hypothetical protein
MICEWYMKHEWDIQHLCFFAVYIIIIYGIVKFNEWVGVL